MRLNVQTDYALRLLMRLALTPEETVTIETVAREYGISRNHLMKVAHHLGRLGYVGTVRGRSGGLRLGKDAAAIRLGDVVRHIEPDFALVECMHSGEIGCRIGPACRLKGVLRRAMAGFIAVLDAYTLAELVEEPRGLADLLGVGA